MDEMIRYIFGSLRNSDAALHAISKALKKQGSFNRNVVFIGMAMTMHIVIQDMKIHNVRCELNALKKDIKELKNTEGD